MGEKIEKRGFEEKMEEFLQVLENAAFLKRLLGRSLPLVLLLPPLPPPPPPLLLLRG